MTETVARIMMMMKQTVCHSSVRICKPRPFTATDQPPSARAAFALHTERPKSEYAWIKLEDVVNVLWQFIAQAQISGDSSKQHMRGAMRRHFSSCLLDQWRRLFDAPLKVTRLSKQIFVARRVERIDLHQTCHAGFGFDSLAVMRQ